MLNGRRILRAVKVAEYMRWPMYDDDVWKVLTKHQTPNTQDIGHWTLDTGHWTLDTGHRTQSILTTNVAKHKKDC